MPPTWFPLLLAPFVGSFLGVLVRRLPAGRPVALDRSRCDTCGTPLAPRDLVPFLSFVLLRGRCRRCRAPIGWFHPAMEAAALLVAASAVWANPGDPAWPDPAWPDPAWPIPTWLLASCVLGWALLALAVIDARHLWLPDVLTLPLLLAGLAATAALDPGALADHAAAAALAWLAFRALALAYRRLRGRDGLGEGDAKLLAALGAWGGIAALPPAVLGAALLGLLLAAVTALRRGAAGLNQVRFPLGTLLAAAFWALWLCTAAG